MLLRWQLARERLSEQTRPDFSGTRMHHVAGAAARGQSDLLARPLLAGWAALSAAPPCAGYARPPSNSG